MKITINVECSPEEMKKMLNLPDVSKIVEEKIKESIPSNPMSDWTKFWMIGPTAETKNE